MGRVVFSLPELGEGIHEGEVVKWLVRVGASVEEDTPLVEVQNDKAVVEIPSPYTGVVRALLVQEGETVTVGAPLLELDVRESKDEAMETTGVTSAEVKSAKVKSAEVTSDEVTSAEKENRGSEDVAGDQTHKVHRRVLAMPSVRRYARAQGIDLKEVTGSGPHGRILRQDVENVLKHRQRLNEHETLPENDRLTVQARDSHVDARDVRNSGSQDAKPEKPAAREGADVTRLSERSREPLVGTRRVIAETMVRSVTHAPHVTLMDEVEVSPLVDLRTRFKEEGEKRGVKLTYLPFIMKAVAGALKMYPYVNATLDEERQEIVTYADIHIGVAVDAPRGLVVPVVRDVPRLSIWEMAMQLQELLKKSREGQLKPSDLKGGTFSISNIGSQGGSFFTPIIHFPQVAILGVGKIKEAPIVYGEQITVGKLLPLSLSFDHRVIDGAMAQAFLNQIKRMLSDPLLMLMEG